MRSKDTEFAAVNLLRYLVCGGVKVEWGRYKSRSSDSETECAAGQIFE